EPGDLRPRAAVERLAADLDLWRETAETYEAVTGKDLADNALRGALLARLGEIYQDKLRAPDKAESAYKRLLDSDPGNVAAARPAAQALEKLYEARQAWPEL